jgi:hypothetical protein
VAQQPQISSLRCKMTKKVRKKPIIRVVDGPFFFAAHLALLQHAILFRSKPCLLASPTLSPFVISNERRDLRLPWSCSPRKEEEADSSATLRNGKG